MLICVEFWPNVRVHVEEEYWDTTKWPGRLSIYNVGRIPPGSIAGKQTWDGNFNPRIMVGIPFPSVVFFLGGGSWFPLGPSPQRTQPLVPNFGAGCFGARELDLSREKCRMWCSRCSSGRCWLAMGPLQQGWPKTGRVGLWGGNFLGGWQPWKKQLDYFSYMLLNYFLYTVRSIGSLYIAYMQYCKISYIWISIYIVV